MSFFIDPVNGVKWIDSEESISEDVKDSLPDLDGFNKQEMVGELLKAALSDGPCRATDIRELMEKNGISDRTLLHTKKVIGITSFRKGGAWYWQLQSQKENT